MDGETLFDSISGTTMDLSPTSFDDDLDDLGNMSDGDSIEQLDSSAGPKRKSRKLPSNAERRANHNAVERARRESLNGRFMELARALPSMTVNKRPSKNAIVSKSLEYVKSTRAREQALESENARLRKEVNELRAKLGIKPLEPAATASATAPAPTVKSSSSGKKTAPTSKQQSPAVSKPRSASLAQPSGQTMAAAHIGVPSIARTNSAPMIPTTTVTGPYLAQDPLSAAALFGFIDPFAAAAAAAATAPTKAIASSPSESTSDTESSIVMTPTSSYAFDGASLSPLFFEDSGHVGPVQGSAFEHDLLAACGMPTTFATPALPTWNVAPAPGLAFGEAPSYALYA